MNGPLRTARLDWTQGTPFSLDFGDVYFSREGGPDETRHVFLAGNGLPERFSGLTSGGRFTIAETGFGTGLNFLVTLRAWQDADVDAWLHYISVEKLPLSKDDLCRAHDVWPALRDLAAQLQQYYPVLVPGFHRLVFPSLRATLTLFLGGIDEFLPRTDARADAWFLDGFAPSRNPDMWTDALFSGIARCSRPGATFATFTAAGDVRRGLIAAGFEVEKSAGFGKKREMLAGRITTPMVAPTRAATPWFMRPHVAPLRREACVVGAGIAGCQVAHRLALRGWRVTVIEKESVANAGSGNPAAVVYGRLAAPGKALDHFPQASWLFMVRELSAQQPADPAWHPCGILQLATGNQAALADPIHGETAPLDFARPVRQEEASALAGIPVKFPAVYFPTAGWLDARRYCHSLLNHPQIETRTGEAVISLSPHEGEWSVGLSSGEHVGFPIVVLASAGAIPPIDALSDLPLSSIRGQVSLAPSTPESAALRLMVCHDGYISPALPEAGHCLGATFHPGDTDTSVRVDDHRANRELLAQALPELAASLPPETEWTGRAALRCQSPDYLPLVGPVCDPQEFDRRYAGLRDGKRIDYPPPPVLPGLYVNLAHGSKGFSQAALAAEILAAEINDEPAPVSRAVLDALHPMRFRVRQLRRGR